MLSDFSNLPTTCNTSPTGYAHAPSLPSTLRPLGCPISQSSGGCLTGRANPEHVYFERESRRSSGRERSPNCRFLALSLGRKVVTDPGGSRPLAGQRANEGCEEGGGGGPAIGGGARRAGVRSRAGSEPVQCNGLSPPPRPSLPALVSAPTDQLQAELWAAAAGCGLRKPGLDASSPPYPRSCA